MFRKTIAALAFALVTLSASAAELRASPEDAQDLVKTAVKVIQKKGKDKAFQDFQNKSGSFIVRDLYIFVYDLKGNCLAHGADPSRVGKNYADAKDGDGKPFMAERLELMKAKTSAWQDYKFKNPENGKVEQKTAYMERVDDMIVGAGVYK
jgi:cytochrome c